MRCSSSDSQTTTVSLNDPPIPYELAFVRGDHVVRKFFFSGIVYTAARPVDALDVPILDEDLPAPWEERYWHAEIRSSYASTMRYYNGWAPWYGSSPTNWTWWNHASLKAKFSCYGEYDAEREGTVVTITLPSESSAMIMPSTQQVYHWDLESGFPVTKVDDEPVYFDHLKTWVSGGVSVAIDWTLMTPMRPVYV